MLRKKIITISSKIIYNASPCNMFSIIENENPELRHSSEKLGN